MAAGPRGGVKTEMRRRGGGGEGAGIVGATTKSRVANKTGAFLRPVFAILRRSIGAIRQVRGGGEWEVEERRNKWCHPTRECSRPAEWEKEELEKLLMKMKEAAVAWGREEPSNVASLLRKCLPCVVDQSEEGARASVTMKGSYGSGIGEELMGFIPVVTGMREFARAMEGVENGILDVKSRDDGRKVLQTFPTGIDGLLFAGWRGEVWLQPDCDIERGCVDPTVLGTVGLVLGAGNHLPVVMLDIIERLIKGQCVVCKMNPVNDYLGPFIRAAFQPFIDRGVLEIVYGGEDIGKFLCRHDAIASIHLTGSPETFEKIVWNGEVKKKETQIKKQVTAELGCVTPYIVCPGEWTDADLQRQAEQIVSALINNAGHACLKPEILITCRKWPQRARFLDYLRAQLNRVPQRAAYYPGSEEKFQRFLQKFPDAEVLGQHFEQERKSGQVFSGPLLLQTGLAPEEADLETENWCTVLQEVALDCKDDATSFLPSSVDLCNTKIRGTLSCSLFIDPATEIAEFEAYDNAIASLRYGSICVNCPTLLGFGATPLSWGAHQPGGDSFEIGSGNCVVHNSQLLSSVQKSVIKVPWQLEPTPIWIPSNRNLESTAKRLIDFTASPTVGKFVALAIAAMNG